MSLTGMHHMQPGQSLHVFVTIINYQGIIHEYTGAAPPHHPSHAALELVNMTDTETCLCGAVVLAFSLEGDNLVDTVRISSPQH